MQQRAMIAMAIASNPMMLISDEPTTALDVTTQAQILDLIRDLNKVTGTSVLFITHDLAVIAEMCERLGVMYAGNLVEEGPAAELFNNPSHPYTTGLLSSVPRADIKSNSEIKLESIPGSVPNLITPPTGCRFHPRCKFKMDICAEQKPALVPIDKDHKVACFLYSKEVTN
jgi:peptide/nickel transport system ATP-binding protein